MTDPFASALDAIFSAPGSEAAEHLSVEGLRTPGIRIIRSRNDQMARLGDAQIVTGSHRIEIRKSEVADLSEGDTLFVGHLEGSAFVEDEELVLTGEAVSDDENLTWTIGAEPVDTFR